MPSSGSFSTFSETFTVPADNADIGQTLAIEVEHYCSGGDGNGQAVVTDFDLNLTAVPEPATLGLLCAGGLLGALARRRRSVA